MLTLRIVMSSAVQYSLTFQHITIALVLLRPVSFHHLVFQFIHQVLCHHSRWISFCLLLPSHLNIPHWCHYLSHYQDAQICDFLEYGSPAGYDYLSFGFPQCQIAQSPACCFQMRSIPICPRKVVDMLLLVISEQTPFRVLLLCLR